MDRRNGSYYRSAGSSSGKPVFREAYLCGSPAMIQACIKILQAKAVAKNRIFYVPSRNGGWLCKTIIPSKTLSKICAKQTPVFWAGHTGPGRHSPGRRRRRAATRADTCAYCPALACLAPGRMAGLGEPGLYPPFRSMRGRRARHTPVSVWRSRLHAQKVNTTVCNLKSGKEITFTDLNIHLIAKHGFYEGRSAQFRLDPEQLIDTLEMVNNTKPLNGP